MIPFVHKCEFDTKITISIRFEVMDFMWPTLDSEESPIGLSWEDFNELFPELEEFSIREKEESGGLVFEATFEITFGNHISGYKKLSSYISLVAIKEGDLPLVEFVDNSDMKINLAHPLIEGVNKQLAEYGKSLTGLITDVFPTDTHPVDDGILTANMQILITVTLYYLHHFPGGRRSLPVSASTTHRSRRPPPCDATGEQTPTGVHGGG